MAPPGSKIGRWYKGHKPEALLGVGGIAVTVIVAVRARAKNAASGTTGTTATPVASTAVPTSTADTTDSDAFNGLEDQILGLQQAVVGLGTQTTSGGAPGTGSGTGGGSGSGGTTGGGGTTPQPGSNQSAPNPTQSWLASLLPVGTWGVQTAQAAPYALGQEDINDAQYTVFDFPTGTPLSTIDSDLYGGADVGQGLLNEYDPTGSTEFALPVYPNEPVAPLPSYVTSGAAQPAAGPA